MLWKCDISWGRWSAYYADKYLPVQDFSGHVSVDNGTICDVEKLVFPQDSAGPFVYSKRVCPYGSTAFESVVHNWFDGIRITCEGDAHTVVHLHTAMGDLSFSKGELDAQKHLSKLVGGKYSMTLIHVEGEEPWYLEEFPADEHILKPDDFVEGTVRTLFRMTGICADPHTTNTAFFTLPVLTDQSVCRLRYRFLANAKPNEDARIRTVPHLELRVNGARVWSNIHFSMYHDTACQYVDEFFVEVERQHLNEGENRLEIVNLDDICTILTTLVGVQVRERQPLELSAVPAWGMVGEPVILPLQVNLPATLMDIDYDHSQFVVAMSADTVSTQPLRQQLSDLNKIGVNEEQFRALASGCHTFYFIPLRAARDAEITFTDRWSGAQVTATIPEIWEVPEGNTCLAGAEVRTDTPDESLEEVRRIRDEQSADLIYFRDYHNDCGRLDALWQAAEFCRKNGLRTESIIMDNQAVIAAASGDKCFGVGSHEHTGIFYGRDAIRDAGYTMEEAEREAVASLKAVADAFRIPGVPVSMGDASGGSRYAYMAGFDVLRCETFVGHSSLLLPNARGAARAFDKDLWGAHIASQHNAKPELEYGIRRYYLGVYLPYMMGAGFVFEEDSQFQHNTTDKMVRGDYLPREKNRIMKRFLKYSKTHPRKGRPLVDIAVLQGRFAPPISGLSCANNGGVADHQYENENYPVWSHYGNKRWSWGYRQPEKGLHLLELMAPGIFLTPLMQDTINNRKFFSGAPRGEFDFLPVQASVACMAQYRLMLLLDWHTMKADGEDYEKLLSYAKNGGTVFLSVPQLSTRVDREFLEDMNDLQLYAQGDVSALCGVRVGARSHAEFSEGIFCGGWQDKVWRSFDSIRRPNVDENEDGPCHLAEIELCGAEVVVKDRVSGQPLIVRHQVGCGWVYLLCTYAYPGHEMLKTVMPTILDNLITDTAEQYVRLEGECEDIYMSVWGENNCPDKLYLLNTDWTIAGNTKSVRVVTPGAAANFTVTEGRMREITLLEDGFLWMEDTEASLTRIDEGLYTLCCMKDTHLQCQASRSRVYLDGVPVTDRITISAGNHTLTVETAGK